MPWLWTAIKSFLGILQKVILKVSRNGTELENTKGITRRGDLSLLQSQQRRPLGIVMTTDKRRWYPWYDRIDRVYLSANIVPDLIKTVLALFSGMEKLQYQKLQILKTVSIPRSIIKTLKSLRWKPFNAGLILQCRHDQWCA